MALDTAETVTLPVELGDRVKIISDFAATLRSSSICSQVGGWGQAGKSAFFDLNIMMRLFYTLILNLDVQLAHKLYRIECYTTEPQNISPLLTSNFLLLYCLLFITTYDYCSSCFFFLFCCAVYLKFITFECYTCPLFAAVFRSGELMAFLWLVP